MKKYDFIETEIKYQKKWKEEQTYVYDSLSSKKKFVIDTPPPTVSGSLHLGHIFSYTHTDIIARFKRMSGYNVFYPMGWDDNGLPTERRTQNLYGIQCDPRLDYQADFKPEKIQDKKPVYKAVSRQNFLELCNQQILEDEKKYKDLWNSIALSVDWNQNYQTIGNRVQTLSQYSFLDLYRKKLVENRLSPVLWDTQFQTAVAQADVEDREKESFYNDIAFQVIGGGGFVISTTRPELLPACVAAAAHPEDERYQKFFGKQALTPLFGRRIPIKPSRRADPAKGTGILMICTFGDMEDVRFCQKEKIEALQMIDEKGFLMDLDFTQGLFKSENCAEAQSYYSHLKALRVQKARKKIVEILKEKKYLRGEPKARRSHVKFYEKGDFPLEILPKRQWYVKILDYKRDFFNLANQIQWHPPHIKNRLEQWVEGLNQDWCISRQRVYGVPFPVWYSIDQGGRTNYKDVLIPKDFQAALDPLKKTPDGFKEQDRGRPGGFKADTDVMDTWASSSLTPFINSHWFFDKQRHESLFPADLRPQGHEIIRTWAFYTIVKSCFHEGVFPWRNIVVSGWVMAPDRAKMSKSKGNALKPESLVKTHSADAVRYWASKAGLAQDTVYDENLFKIGKRLTAKIFNAGRFVQLQLKGQNWLNYKNCLENITQPLDQVWMIALLEAQRQALEYLELYQHHLALNLIEKQFWVFCDDYLELVKARAYQLRDTKEGRSAQAALDLSLYLFLKLFAPFLPYITEEIWQSRYKSSAGSLHRSLYFEAKELEKLSLDLKNRLSDKVTIIKRSFKSHTVFSAHLISAEGVVREGFKNLSAEFILETAFSILGRIRKAKSSLGRSLAVPLKKLELMINLKQGLTLPLYEKDLFRASHVDPENTALKISKEEKALNSDNFVKIEI